MDARKLGPAFPVDEDWKAKVRSELKTRSISLATLGDAVGARSPSIHFLLGPKSKSSSLVPAIHEFFGWPLPGIPSVSTDRQEIMSIVDKLDEDGRKWLLEQAQSYRRIMERATKK